MNVYQITESKLKELYKKRKEMLFPEYLTGLRMAHRLSRTQVCLETGIGAAPLGCMETGRYMRILPISYIETLAKYYDVDMKTMKQMADYYITAGYGTKQHTPGKIQ